MSKKTSSKVFIFLALPLVVALMLYGGMMWGSEEISVAANPLFHLEEYEGNVYYQSFEDNRRLYRMDLQGQDKIALSRDSVSSFVIHNDQLYYAVSLDTSEQTIVIAALNGDVIQKMTVGEAAQLWFVSDGWVYYSQAEGLYRISETTTTIEQISDLRLHTVIPYEGDLYFSSVSEHQEGLYRTDLAGNGRVQLYKGDIPYFKLDQDRVIFPSISERYRLYQIRLTDYAVEPLSTAEAALAVPTGAFDVFDGKVYFTNDQVAKDSYLYEWDMTKEHLTQLERVEATTVKAYAERIYLYHPSHGGRLDIVSVPVMKDDF